MASTTVSPSHRRSLPSILNLELMWDYGANTWKIYNTTLQTMLEQAQKQLMELRYVFLRESTIGSRLFTVPLENESKT